MRSFSALVATAALVSSLVAAPAAAQGLIDDGEAPDVIVLHTGDVIGFVDPCG